MEHQVRQVPKPPYTDLVMKYVTSADSILDVGCGEGYIATVLQRKFPKAKVVGCDLSLESLIVASHISKLNDAPAQFDYCDIAGAVPYTDKSFDTVISTATLMMMPERDALNAFNNMKRLAKKQIILAELHIPNFGEKETNYNGVFGRYGRDYRKFLFGLNITNIEPIVGWPGSTYVIDGSVINIIL